MLTSEIIHAKKTITKIKREYYIKNTIRTK